jgi:hypothetical protein
MPLIIASITYDRFESPAQVEARLRGATALDMSIFDGRRRSAEFCGSVAQQKVRLRLYTAIRTPNVVWADGRVTDSRGGASLDVRLSVNQGWLVPTALFLMAAVAFALFGGPLWVAALFALFVITMDGGSLWLQSCVMRARLEKVMQATGRVRWFPRGRPGE